MTHPYDQSIDDQFDRITRQETPVTNDDNMNGPLAIGIILILLAIASLIVWGFGADRFLWIAAGTGGGGVLLTGIGAVMGRGK